MTTDEAQKALSQHFVCQACGSTVSTRAEVTPVRCFVCRQGTFAERALPPDKTS